MLKSQIASFLYSVGVNYHEFGTIKQGKKKVFDYFKAERLTDNQKSLILESIPNCEFKTSSHQYAPEIKRALICIPVGKIPKKKIDK